jgi:hypothetical protein
MVPFGEKGIGSQLLCLGFMAASSLDFRKAQKLALFSAHFLES